MIIVSGSRCLICKLCSINGATNNRLQPTKLFIDHKVAPAMSTQATPTLPTETELNALTISSQLTPTCISTKKTW